MRIECKITFLDDFTRFESGDIRQVEDTKAEYFIAQGWASRLGDSTEYQTSESTSTDLGIDSLNLTKQMETANG